MVRVIFNRNIKITHLLLRYKIKLIPKKIVTIQIRVAFEFVPNIRGCKVEMCPTEKLQIQDNNQNLFRWLELMTWNVSCCKIQFSCRTKVAGSAKLVSNLGKKLRVVLFELCKQLIFNQTLISCSMSLFSWNNGITCFNVSMKYPALLKSQRQPSFSSGKD